MNIEVPPNLTLSQKEIFLDFTQAYAEQGISITKRQYLLLELLAIQISKMRNQTNDVSIEAFKELRMLINDCYDIPSNGEKLNFRLPQVETCV